LLRFVDLREIDFDIVRATEHEGAAMHASKTLAAIVVALIVSAPRIASATSIAVGVVSFDTFVAGPDGTNAFFVSNLTGDPGAGGFALPPDFPIAALLVFDSPLLQFSGPAGSPFDFGGVGLAPGGHDPDPQIQFSDAVSLLSARFTATLSQPIFQLTDGRFFAAASTTIDALVVNPGGALAPGDYVVLAIDADEVSPTAVPEPASLALAVTGLAGIWRARRRRRSN
jgi:PEP-CTERM motif